MTTNRENRSRNLDPGLYEALGRAIKTLRTARGIERADLAERSEVSYPYLSEIENGRKRASSSALGAIAEALGMSLAELMTTAEELRPTVATADADAAYAPRQSWFSSAPRASYAMSGSARSRASVDEVRALLEGLSPEDLARVRDLIVRLLR